MNDITTWTAASTATAATELEPWFTDDVELIDSDRIVSGRAAVAAQVFEALGQNGKAELIEFSEPSVVAFRYPEPDSGDLTATVLTCGFTDEGRIRTLSARRLPPPARPVGIEHEYRTPEALLGGPDRALPEGISLRPFAAAKRVTKRWGNETWLHNESHPFGFKVIRLLAGCRTSLQFHEQKDEVYFVLEGLARLHHRDGTVIRTAPFIQGTVALVPPMAWHRVEAITDVTLIEASTYDDGSDNVRVEDDYGRPNVHIGAEHGE